MEVLHIIEGVTPEKSNYFLRCPKSLSRMSPNNIYQLGFSKCGTSSIFKFFTEFPPTQSRCLRTSGGAIEFDMRYDLEDAHRKLLSQGGCYLKFSGAAFGVQAVEEIHNIALSFGDPIYLLSIRSPAQVLTSWFNMHKRMAKSGVNKNHFAVKQRDKYLAMTLDEYAKIHLGKLNYSWLIERFRGAVGESSIWILDFRKVKHGVKAVMGDFLDQTFAGFDYENEFPCLNIGTYENGAHPELSSDIIDRCNDFEQDIDAFLASMPRGNTCLGSSSH